MLMHRNHASAGQSQRREFLPKRLDSEEIVSIKRDNVSFLNLG
jgi:hypothetical protein